MLKRDLTNCLKLALYLYTSVKLEFHVAVAPCKLVQRPLQLVAGGLAVEHREKARLFAERALGLHIDWSAVEIFDASAHAEEVRRTHTLLARLTLVEQLGLTAEDLAGRGRGLGAAALFAHVDLD